jgi:hypothetical protein
MLFCEDCRIKKMWPNSAVVQQGKCEICKRFTECFDVPAVLTVPEHERSLEQKMIYRIMQEAFKDKAENLVVTHASGSEAGKLNHRLTGMLHEIIAKRGSEIDWYETYNLRLAVQSGYQRAEEFKSNRR